MYRKNLTFPQIEKIVLDFWRENNVFEQSKTLSKDKKRYVIFDGPPFATGLPHYGHILSGAVKDTVGRFFYQQNYRVDRRFGWDCHGLPVEYEIDKMLGITDRAQVAKMGIEKYNSECRGIVMKYSEQWKETVERMGRWTDFENGYRTMDLSFMESVWNVFSGLFKMGMVYRGYKVMPFSTACKTPLSNFEANQNYKEVSDPSVLIKFPLKEEFRGMRVSLVAWTTTPWTLPANCALVVNRRIEYSVIETKNGLVIIGSGRVSEYFRGSKVIESFSGEELVGREYSQPFKYYEDLREKGFFRVLHGEFVAEGSGTSVVHCAPGFGEEDHRVCMQNGLIEDNGSAPLPVDENGCFTLSPYKGVYVKELDGMILRDIKDLVLMNSRAVHSYPFCWRSDTPLIYRLVPNWFIRVRSVRERLLENNEKINWIPSEIKYKRFHNWLRDCKDWAVGRNRFWGTPVPVWVSDDGSSISVGSIKELEELTGKRVEDLHRESVDGLEISKDGKIYRRTEEVLDCWFESGSMPYAQDHWPFSSSEFSSEDKGDDKESIGSDKETGSIQSMGTVLEKGSENTRTENTRTENTRTGNIPKEFPANFIGEGLDQTRGWFYTLHVLSTILFNRPAFKNVICFGIVLAEDGKKMSKRLKNYPAPDLIFEKHGADALRLYLISSVVLSAENLRFSERGVSEVTKTLLIPWYNALNFYRESRQNLKSQNLESQNENTNLNLKSLNESLPLGPEASALDGWILSSACLFCVTAIEAGRSLRIDRVLSAAREFVDDLTNWYIRLARRSIRADPRILGGLLSNFSVLMAPYAPFFSEFCYNSVSNKNSSVHLQMHPTAEIIEHPFIHTKRLISSIRVLRERFRLMVKRPIRKIIVVSQKEFELSVRQNEQLVREECNVLEMEYRPDSDYSFDYSVRPCFEALRKSDGMAEKIAAIRRIPAELESGGISPEELSRDLLVISGLEIRRDELVVEKKFRGVEDSGYFDGFGLVADLTADPVVLEMAAAREAFSLIQKARKRLGLVVSDRILLEIPSQGLEALLRAHYPELEFGSEGKEVGKSELRYEGEPVEVVLHLKSE